MINERSPIAILQRLYATLDRVPLSLLLLVARISTFSVFMRSGLVKLSDWSATLMLFSDEYKVPVLPPAFAAYMAASMELGCSTLILVGLLTRVSVLALFGMITTIQVFVYPSAWPDHIQWIGFMIFILFRGPGEISLDAVLTRKFQWRPAAMGASI